jgi:pimeloyl-ACP methyl ester carboxylesterase
MDVRVPTADDFDALLARRPRVTQTTAGPVELAEAGEGPALLSVHGSGGGWEYALGQAAVFALNGFRVIAPSRPGYFGTPLATGRTYIEQADALAALLEALAVDRAAVLGPRSSPGFG